MSAKHLSEDKELQKRLRENPDLIPGAVEELVRLYTPYRSFARSAAHPVEISGQLVQPGEPLGRFVDIMSLK
jgi:cytochrome P450